MEQEAVFDLGEFDERNISLDETPRDALHYLQQVTHSFTVDFFCNSVRLISTVVQSFHMQ